jgi:hypothetical protein
MTMTALSPSQVAPAVRAQTQSVWRRIFAAMTEGRTARAEDIIAVYLDHHQHDLPPALRIELERRHLVP